MEKLKNTTLKNELPEKIVKVCEECAAQISLIVQLSEGRVIDEAKIADLMYAFMRDLFHEVSAPTTKEYVEFDSAGYPHKVKAEVSAPMIAVSQGGCNAPSGSVWPEVSAPAPTPTKDDLDLSVALHINYCEDLAGEGTPWEVAAEPEPQYFETLKEAIVFLVNLPELAASEVQSTPTDERALMVVVAQAALAKINDYPKEVRDWLRPTIDALRELRDMAAGKK